MKKRVQIDSALLSLMIILSGFLYQFPWLYTSSPIDNNIWDIFGLFIALFGTFLRMVARGYKKFHSKNGHGLVTEGPYLLVRNPMYLGSFLLGAGFLLIVWPWWSLPVFVLLFYLRFRRQIITEEKLLITFFKKDYEAYIKKVPQLIPNFSTLSKFSMKDVLPWNMAWTTKEKWGLLGWPVIALILESFQEKMVYGTTDIVMTLCVVSSSVMVFGIFLWFVYQAQQKPKR